MYEYLIFSLIFFLKIRKGIKIVSLNGSSGVNHEGKNKVPKDVYIFFLSTC